VALVLQQFWQVNQLQSSNMPFKFVDNLDFDDSDLEDVEETLQTSMSTVPTSMNIGQTQFALRTRQTTESSVAP
jgi:hypothetical protein